MLYIQPYNNKNTTTVITFARSGNVASGTYLQIGPVVSNNSGFLVPYDCIITHMSVVVGATAGGTSTFQLRDLNLNDITGATLVLPAASRVLSQSYSIFIPANTSICGILSAGTTRANPVLNVFLERV